jgi:formate hydrogenlyase transcriptional activator
VAVKQTITSEQRHSLVLRAWEAVNSERELKGVLAAVSEIVLPLVPFDGVAIIAFESAGARLFALHVPGHTWRDGETAEQFAMRITPPAGSVPLRETEPYENSQLAQTQISGLPYVCADLLAKKRWYHHEFNLAAAGVRSYASCPLSARGERIGAAVFSRGVAQGFPPDQVTILTDITRAVAVAVANALANEEIERLRDHLQEENIALRTQLGQRPWYEEIAGDSQVLRRVLDSVEQVATTDSTVLITGETGTGKELLARALHRRSARANGPLVKVNCAAIPPSLLASELFGHERGAFTGAVERRKGRFEQANGGTLFLDEIGELPQDMQVLLLRVLQERQLERLGGSHTVDVDVRMVTATNRDLAEEVRAGRFRSDLFYRLNVFPVHMPALRDRREDIPHLVAHFAAKHSEKLGRTITRIDRRTMHLLESYDWPGNVRELENVVERAVIVSRNGTLFVDKDAIGGAVPEGDIDVQLRTQEREAIEGALRTCRGRIAGENGAAKRLGLAASTLEFRIRRLGIDKFKFKAATRE